MKDDVIRGTVDAISIIPFIFHSLTTKTGQGESAITLCVMEPTKKRLTCENPLRPITMRSDFSLLAYLIISSWGSPDNTAFLMTISGESNFVK